MTQTATQTSPIYLTCDEASKLLRISTKTLEKMRVEGTGPRFLKAGNGKRSRVLYQSKDIEAWLEANAYHSTSEY